MPGPLDAQAVASICTHMNDDHADAIVHYARRFANVAGASSARMTGLDASGMDLSVETESEARSVRVDFDHELADADDAHHTLIAMARTP